MTTLFISDLHLEEQRADITELFLNFLQTEAPKAERLYILGDFFESWIGDDDLSIHNQNIIKHLNILTQKIPVFFMHGNRDFLIGKRFLKASGCQLLPDEHVINLYGIPTLLMHGDTLCTEDTKYLKFRKKSRSWWYKKLILLKSLESRRNLAARMRAASRQHTRTTAHYIMDVTHAEVERIMINHQVQHLIHGHTHRQAVHSFILNNKPATRTVLGPWHECGSVLICEKNGDQKFVALSHQIV